MNAFIIIARIGWPRSARFASGLLIARLHELDTAVGNRALEARISMTETFTSACAAIDSIVTRSSFKASYNNGVLLIAVPCAAELAPGFAKNVLNPFASMRLNLTFQQVDIATLLSMLQLAAARDVLTNNYTNDNANNNDNANAIKNEHENNASFNVFSGNALLPVSAQLQNQSARQAYEALPARRVRA